MSKQYSIANARQNLAALVHEVEHKSPIELTRHGETVAVLVSVAEYRRLHAGRSSFWKAYGTFCQAVDLTQLQIDPDILAGLRDQSPGREVHW
ncbi:MAG: type II toxin-antitoxin system Phd/YefM family antitoxin [Chloroflexi bacterium]|nr:type II toxin-antitoxin system Phd/YefM family antitoxin [Chloroflexota bacterium]